ncbi:hypothetical protein [Asticcacaulis solisilvae]|uniref:hypothetical protein n=1 Tax=Asticcacaulis solisilvae TaxID=1217274 RepID=UPI003FD82E23
MLRDKLPELTVTDTDDAELANQWVLDALKFLSEETARRDLRTFSPILSRAFDECLVVYVQGKTAELQQRIGGDDRMSMN